MYAHKQIGNIILSIFSATRVYGGGKCFKVSAIFSIHYICAQENGPKVNYNFNFIPIEMYLPIKYKYLQYFSWL